MGKMKIRTLRTRSIEMKRRLKYWAAFTKLLYKSILEKRTYGNRIDIRIRIRPLFPDFAVALFFCYNKYLKLKPNT